MKNSINFMEKDVFCLVREKRERKEILSSHTMNRTQTSGFRAPMLQPQSFYDERVNYEI